MKKALIICTLLILSKIGFAQTPPTINICFPWTAHAPISLSGVSNQTIQLDSINANGANTILISLTNCHDIHITKCWLGKSGLQAINMFNCYNITIDSCHIENSLSLIHFNSAPLGGLVVRSNQLLNPLGPVSNAGNGQYIQLNRVHTTTVQNIIQNNLMMREFNVGRPEDCVSLYMSYGTAALPILVDHNYIVENGGTNTSSSGGGLLTGDSGGDYQTISNNILVNPGQYGIAVTGGDHNSLINNQVFGAQAPYSNVGVVVWSQQGDSPVPVPITNATVSGNQVNWTSSTGAKNPDWLAPGETTPAGWNTNNWNSTITASILPNPLWTACTAPPVVKAPVLSYLGTPYTYTAGTTIGAITPLNSGGAVTSAYSISQSLPSGLSFNTTTGRISGTPTASSPLTVYTISASNAGGTGATQIRITVNPTPVALPSFTYTPATNVYTIPQIVPTLLPVSTGGAVGSYSISPSLPTGLTFNTSTGAIGGTATVVSGATLYTVTGTNASGSGRATVTITVNPNPVRAPSITYSPASLTATYGIAITAWVPTNTGSAATYTVSPTLPLGYALNPTNGTITGTATVVQGSTAYIVTATNASGTSNYTINITIGKASLVITANSQTKYQGQPNPALTYQVTGLLGVDNINTALQTLPTLTTTAVDGSPVGSYTITPAGAVSANYNVNYANGTLIVILPNQTIVYRIFGGIINQ